MPTVWFVIFQQETPVAAFVNSSQADAFKTAFYPGGRVEPWSVHKDAYTASPITFGPPPAPLMAPSVPAPSVPGVG